MSYYTFIHPRIGLIAILAAVTFISTVPAQIPPEQAKAASAIALNTDLLDKLDKTITAIGADPAAKAEMAAVDKDPAMTSPDNAESVITSKYPKLAAAFKSGGLKVGDFVKVMTALPMSAALAEMGGGTPEDKTAAANVEFYKANKERVTAVMTKLEELEKSGASSPAP